MIVHLMLVRLIDVLSLHFPRIMKKIKAIKLLTKLLKCIILEQNNYFLTALIFYNYSKKRS